MRPRLLFVSPRFLFPADSGGKIRSSQLLRHLKRSHFEITLASPATAQAEARHRADLESICDRFIGWPAGGALSAKLTRPLALAGRLPVSVASDRSPAAVASIAAALATRPDIVVFDFVHAAVFAPDRIDDPSVLFTHNCEAQIFERHAQQNADTMLGRLWHSQAKKMQRFEGSALARFDQVIAVSDQDARQFHQRYGHSTTAVIPTGVDTDYFAYSPPPAGAEIAFTGSMDWAANIDAIEWFAAEVWPAIRARRPDASLRVIGRNPPARLVERLGNAGIRFTGFVDDVRPHLTKASVYVMPIRVGSGTRIKAYEAMAAGRPVVSTAIGVEGLDLEPGRHYLQADTADAFARATLDLLESAERRERLAATAREHVERNYSQPQVAAHFAQILLDTISRHAP
ncbi:MAG: glycosyltransferase [Chromatiales bacterium]|nr:glycosyltransferase [Chromatiales bacterium]